MRLALLLISVLLAASCARARTACCTRNRWTWRPRQQAQVAWRWDEDRDHIEDCAGLAKSNDRCQVILEGSDHAWSFKHLPSYLRFESREPREAPSLNYEDNGPHDLKIRCVGSAEPIFKTKVHEGACLRIAQDVLYWLDYDGSTNCGAVEVAAVDLSTGEEVWRAAIGAGFMYSGMLRTDAWPTVEADRVTAYARENGRPSAIVVLDARSARRIQHCFR